MLLLYDPEKYLTACRRLKGGVWRISPRLNGYPYLIILSSHLRRGGWRSGAVGVRDLPLRLKAIIFPLKVLKKGALLRAFISRRGGRRDPPKIAIYSLKERKSGFYYLHLHLLMRPLVYFDFRPYTRNTCECTC
jgi:hypothetical protein